MVTRMRRFAVSFTAFTLMCSLSVSLWASGGQSDPASSAEKGSVEAANIATMPEPSAELKRAQFTEIWAYLMAGEEAGLSRSMPITDVGYFGAGLNSFGKLSYVPKRSTLKGYHGRVHLVVAEVTNQALTHFCLDPDLPMRAGLVDSIAEAVKPFDGLQIDFELVPASDRENFIAFLSDLKERIGKKPLSVALPARTKTVDDAYDYAAISRIADRIIVMAYDEHWSGSAPGSIASIEWCKKVSAYALPQIGKDKLVMGIPFYGRAWGDATLSKAYRFSGLSRIIEERGVTEISREDGIPSFEYVQPVKVRVFFEDSVSILARAKMYQDSSVQNVSFWRLGQEDPSVWEALAILD